MAAAEAGAAAGEAVAAVPAIRAAAAAGLVPIAAAGMEETGIWHRGVLTRETAAVRKKDIIMNPRTAAAGRKGEKAVMCLA